jgi:hypothetical protein
MLESDAYAVTPPSTMVKFLAMIDRKSMDSALCIVHDGRISANHFENGEHTPIHERELRANGFWTLESVL